MLLFDKNNFTVVKLLSDQCAINVICYICDFIFLLEENSNVFTQHQTSFYLITSMCLVKIYCFILNLKYITVSPNDFIYDTNVNVSPHTVVLPSASYRRVPQQPLTLKWPTFLSYDFSVP